MLYLQQQKEIRWNLLEEKNEVSRLRQIENSGRTEFVVIYGRRRVGKTFLVNSHFNDRFTFKVTWLKRSQV